METGITIILHKALHCTCGSHTDHVCPIGLCVDRCNKTHLLKMI